MSRDKIKSRLLTIEEKKGIEILYACEAGSRAWGFESVDSDYDIRFIYKHKAPLVRYLSIDTESKRDVMEFPIENGLDISGWDIRKTLKLFYKSNPPLMEWLMSPTIYMKNGGFSDRLRDMVDLFNPVATRYHYHHMATGNYRDYLRGDIVWIKKYFYVLRPLFAMRHVELGLGFPPLNFEETMYRVCDNEEVVDEVLNLIEAKRSGYELGRLPAIPVISTFIKEELERANESVFRADYNRVDIDALNDLYREEILG